MNSRELCTYVGVIGGAIAGLFGGWDTALQTLVIFMAVDYITGLIVAGVFHTSPKTKTGTLESRAGWKGLCRKGVSLLVVLVACRLDAIIGSSFIRDATVIAFVCNETISIIENAGLMGVPVPKVLVEAVERAAGRAGGQGQVRLLGEVRRRPHRHADRDQLGHQDGGDRTAAGAAVSAKDLIGFVQKMACFFWRGMVSLFR